MTSPYLSRRETHAFLAVTGEMSFAKAWAYALARSYTQDDAQARRIASSKLAQAEFRAQPFWREAARFFAVQSASREQIDDLCDFFLARLFDDPGFSLKGRTLQSVGALERTWRDQLMIVRRFGSCAGWARRSRTGSLRLSIPGIPCSGRPGRSCS